MTADPSPYDDEPFNIVFLDVVSTTKKIVDKCLNYEQGRFKLLTKRGPHFVVDGFDVNNNYFKIKCIYNKQDVSIVGKWVKSIKGQDLTTTDKIETASQFLLLNQRLLCMDADQPKKQLGYDYHGNIGCGYETPFESNFSMVPMKDDDPDAVFCKFNFGAYEDPQRTKLKRSGFLAHWEENGYMHANVDKVEAGYLYKLVKVFANRFALQVRDRRSKFNGKFAWATTSNDPNSWWTQTGIGNMKKAPREVTDSDSIPFECTLWEFIGNQVGGTDMKCWDSSKSPGNTKDQFVTMDFNTGYLYAKDPPPNTANVVVLSVMLDVLEFSRKLKGGKDFNFLEWANEPPLRLKEQETSSSSSSSFLLHGDDDIFS